jgi:cytochrome o ubiquinol oxidase subunit 1
MSIFGLLSTSALYHQELVATGAQVAVVAAAIAVVGLLTYTRRWSWLWREWLTSLDHKKIGVMYLVLSVVMLARGFVDAALMRSQQALAVGSPGYLSPEHFAEIFTAHGVIMIFFAAMPFMFGLINLVLPLQIGSRDVAFPFLNSVSLWLTATGAMLLNTSLVIGQFAATGWLAYPPLSELAYSPGVGVDYYIWALQIAGVGTLISGINFLATIATMRVPGMKMMRMPLFVWTTLGSMILVIFAFPILTVTLALLSLDRTLGMHFFTPELGGNAMMYVNLIWAWGHPEVYILILPAFGIFSEVVATFSRKRLFGYTSMVVATMAIVFLSFIVWVHHFFTMGAGADVNTFFGIMTMAIAVPTGVKVFNWLFTMFRGRISFKTPMLWFMGFLTTFTIGGMTGVLMSIPGADYMLHNSLFLVAHFHNMIIGGVLFGFFAGFVYWFPKFSGFMLEERIGKWAFWAWILGFLLAFMPLYLLGLMGATRRLYTIDPSMGYGWLFWVAAFGVCVIACAGALQVVQLVVSVKNRKKLAVGSDPWNGRTLEWSLPSPPPVYNFAQIPQVHSRDAFWQMKQEANGSVNDGKAWPSGLERRHELTHERIILPKNSGIGFLMSVCAFAFGFGLVWHIWWLAVLGLAGIAALLIYRSFEKDIDETISL